MRGTSRRRMWISSDRASRNLLIRWWQSFKPPIINRLVAMADLSKTNLLNSSPIWQARYIQRSSIPRSKPMSSVLGYTPRTPVFVQWTKEWVVKLRCSPMTTRIPYLWEKVCGRYIPKETSQACIGESDKMSLCRAIMLSPGSERREEKRTKGNFNRDF